MIEAATLEPNGTFVVKKIRLSDTLADLDELNVTITTRANND